MDADRYEKKEKKEKEISPPSGRTNSSTSPQEGAHEGTSSRFNQEEGSKRIAAAAAAASRGYNGVLLSSLATPCASGVLVILVGLLGLGH